MRTRPGPLLAALPVVVALLLGACSGGGSANGVATLSGASGASAAAAADTSDAPTEQEILDWVECMRKEGLDIPDPTVDEEGNLVLGGGPRGGVAGPQAGGGATTATTVAGATNTPPDREAFRTAVEACGQPPRAGGTFSEADQQDFQDAALKLAQCMRDEGIDVADPDFSDTGPGGPPAEAGADDENATAGVRRSPFGDIDMSDPAVQAASQVCRDKLGDAFPVGPGGGRGGGVPADAAPAGEDS